MGPGPSAPGVSSGAMACRWIERFWLGCLAGGILAPIERPPWREPTLLIPREEQVPPRALAARDLRSVPGVGRTRALALVRAYWEQGEGLDVESVTGVGPVTGEALRQFIDSGRGEGAAREGPVDRPRR